MPIRQFLDRPVEWLDPRDSLADAAERMRAHDVDLVPVQKDGRCLGFVTDLGILEHLVAGDDLRLLSAGRCAVAGGVVCHADDPVDAAVRASSRRRPAPVLVLDAAQRLVGVLPPRLLWRRRPGWRTLLDVLESAAGR